VSSNFLKYQLKSDPFIVRFNLFIMRSFTVLALSSVAAIVSAAPAPQVGTGVNDPNYNWQVTGWSAGCARSGCYYGKYSNKFPTLFCTNRIFQISTSPAQNTPPQTQQSRPSPHTAPEALKEQHSSHAVYSTTDLETEVLLQGYCLPKWGLVLTLK
jgi:hypothetical protein